MNDKTRVIDVTPDNLSDYPQFICYINPKHETYGLKVDWFKARFKEGLRIKLLYAADEKKPAGFIEYVPGEYAWRAVHATDWLFIHCIWIYANKRKNQGLGSQLVKECLKDAKSQDKSGVVVVTGGTAFMAGAELFLKNGFKSVAESGGYTLLAKPLRKSKMPEFFDWESQLDKFKGLNIVYSKQCPWVARFIHELDDIIKERNLKITIKELKNAKQAQNAPSVYSVFSLIYNGKLLADHYISRTRFINILDKEIDNK
jgi:ribosomal protein S18 acetylase RimI-like enzyme